VHVERAAEGRSATEGGVEHLMESIIFQLVLMGAGAIGLSPNAMQLLMQILPQALAQLEARLPREEVVKIALAVLRAGGETAVHGFAWLKANAAHAIPWDELDEAGNYHAKGEQEIIYTPLEPDDPARGPGGG
jgi:hypothetical protein